MSSRMRPTIIFGGIDRDVTPKWNDGERKDFREQFSFAHFCNG